MRAEEIVDIVKIMYGLGATVEYIPELEIGNPEICFYHIIDNVNVSRGEINTLMNNLGIPYSGNASKLNGNTIYLTVYF